MKRSDNPIAIVLYDDSEEQIRPCRELQQKQVEHDTAKIGLMVASNEQRNHATFYPFFMDCVQGPQCPLTYMALKCSDAAMNELDAEHQQDDHVRHLAHAFVYGRNTANDLEGSRG